MAQKYNSRGTLARKIKHVRRKNSQLCGCVRCKAQTGKIKNMILWPKQLSSLGR